MPFVALALWVIGLYILYWVIRLAVRHALEDVGVRRLVNRSDDEAAAEDIMTDEGQDDSAS